MKTLHFSWATAVFGSLLLLFPTTGQPAGTQVLRGQVPAAVASLPPTGRFAGTNHLNLAIGLPLRNSEALSNLLQQINNPASPAYHHYLTPEQFTERFGPTRTDYQAVIAFAQAHGLRVIATHPNRLLLDVNGSVTDVERALGVTLRTYRHPVENRTFYAPDTEPALALATPILHIGGLENYSLPRPHFVIKPLVNGQNAAPSAGSGPGGGYIGNDFRTAYVPNSSLTGSGQTVGLLQFDGYTASDIAYYEDYAGLPHVALQNVLLDGSSGLPSGTGGELEVSLDIEMAIAMAPSLSKVIVYEAPNPSPFEDILNRMVTDNLAKQLSCSWYIPSGGANPVTDQIFQQMAAQGQSFFNASGDSDAYTGLIDFPGDSPYITQVGGTTLTSSGTGGAWSSETVWNWGGGIGSGGGISTQYPIPKWQTNISMTLSQGSKTKRNTPDVALTADNVYVRVNGQNHIVGGTSCAAPLWAGFAALANQQAATSGKPPIGFINPAVDAICTSTKYASAFHDITTGNNEKPASPTKFLAVTGYDLCTGWGTPAGQNLIDALANPEALVITPSTGFTSIGGFGGPFTVTSELFSVTNAGTNSLTWTLANPSAWLTASPSGGTLSPGGPATAVTVRLNFAASNLVVGTYNTTVWFTNLNDNFGQSRQFTLSVISPPVITQQPTNQSVLEGAAAAFTVTAAGGLPLSYQWRDNGTNLTDDTNLSGTTTANLIIRSASPANVGTYTVIVTNVAGMATSSNALLLLPPSPPVIVAQPTNQTVYVGATAQFNVAVLGSTPFSFQWCLNGTNLLEATNSSLVLTDAQFDQAGLYTVSVTNNYGSILSSNALLTVVPQPPCLPEPPGAVAWWPGEGAANDIVGTNNGTPTGVGFVAGEVGQAFSFDGSTSQITALPSPSLAVSNMTLEAWVYPKDTSARPVIDYGGAGQRSPIQLWVNSLGGIESTAGAIHAVVVSDSGGGEVDDVNPDVKLNQWNHVAFTVDTATGAFVLYCNGSLVASNTASIPFIPPQDLVNVNIGYRDANSAELLAGSRFYGYLDEVSIYNRALSSNEIAAIYLAGSKGKCTPPMPPTIIVQPADQIAAVGGNATFNVTAIGSMPLSYQWNFNGTNIVGATNSSLMLTDVQLSQAGNYAVTVTNVFGSALCSNAVLTVGLAPTITTQPASRTNLVGTTATFTVVAAGSPTLTYQWLKNGTPIVGAADTNLTIVNVQTNDAGTYAVLVTNAFGSIMSSGATLTVWAPPLIMVQPANQTVIVSNSATFSVTAVGTTPLFYQWNFNGTNLVGATNTLLTLTNVQFSQAGNYAVLVTNAYGSVSSSNAILTVVPPPSCSSAPSGLVAWWPGEGNANDIMGTNNGTVSGVGFVTGEVGQAFSFDGSTSLITALASPGLAVSNMTLEAWVYPKDTTARPVIDYGGAGQRSPIQLWINTLGGTGSTAGAIHAVIVSSSGGGEVDDVNPDVKLNQWNHLVFTVNTTNRALILYCNGSLVASNTASSPFVPPQSLVHVNIGYRDASSAELFAGKRFYGYLDEVSIYNRALSSNEIAAIYNAGASGKCPLPPAVLAQPTNQTVAVGGTATFSVRANGTQPLTYQWLFSGTNIPGATNASLTLTSVQPVQSGTYAVQVANVAGWIISSNALLTVNTPPGITTPPASSTNIAGTTASFTVVATGSSPMTYQWKKNNANIAGATATNFTITNVQTNDAATYCVAITNAFGSIISSNAELTVRPLFHFTWNQIPSPRFANAPFAVVVQALNPSNGLAANFTNTVVLLSTNGVPVNPAVSGKFVQGIWNGTVTIAQTVPNLVLQASDSSGGSGLANPINVVSLPALATTPMGGTFYVFWPVSPTGFGLETTAGLSPANWVPVTTPPFQIGNQYLLPITMSGTNAFYRLRFSDP